MQTGIIQENNVNVQREKALEVLAKAKAQEANSLKKGKKYHRINNRTYVLL